jgi:hypothetical protein
MAKWIAKAIKHPGAEYEQEHKGDKGTAGKRARLAITLKHMKKK